MKQASSCVKRVLLVLHLPRFSLSPRRMSTNENEEQNQSITESNQSLKVAIAMALLRSKLFQNQIPNTSSTTSASSESDAQRWKRKAKDRKQELLRIKEELKEAEDSQQHDHFVQSASCKCYFFGNLGNLSPKGLGDGSDRRFDDVLRRRFLRQVRLKERKRRRTGGSIHQLPISELHDEDVMEQLSSSVDFLVELCDTVSPAEEAKFANWSHQAVDFITASLKKLLSMGNNMETVEGIISSLIMRLVRRMCTPLQGEELHHSDVDPQCYVQHLIRKLGTESYVGQRAILSVSQRISVVAESLLFMDPFDDAFPTMHNCMFLMIQLVEFLVSDYLLIWSGEDAFDNTLFEEWVTSVLHARKSIELLESRNGLYVLYMDRVTGELAKLVGQASSLQKLNPDVRENLIR